MNNKLCNSFAEEKAKEALSLKSFSALNLESIKQTLKEALEQNRSNGIFREYTQHDISHIDGMLSLLDDIIPQHTKDIMTPADWMMVVLSFYFHDFGMLVTEDEISKRDSDNDFLNYKKKMKSSSISDDEIYQNYIRDNHGERVFDWLLKLDASSTVSETHLDLLRGMIGTLSPEIHRDLAKLCKSHGENLAEIQDSLDVNQQYEQSPSSRVNLLYVASLLRTADILHINSERTPDIVRKIISPQNQYSKTEWDFQNSVTCIRPLSERDRNNNVDPNIQPHAFEVKATFINEDAYSRFKDYIFNAEKQLIQTHDVCRDSCLQNQNGYEFPWDSINCNSIKTEGFNADPLKFELDKDNILKLLIGHTLYSNSNVVLRELAQNAIDACRLMDSNSKVGSSDYQPRVVITWKPTSRELVIQDNGTGMDEHIIKNYLFKVGASRYQSDEFKKQNSDFHSISRFGIGLLTCFMISDEFEITTLWHKEKKAHKLRIKGIGGECIMRNDAQTDDILDGKHGTTFVLKVREDVEFDNVANNLKSWIVVPQCKVEYKEETDDSIRIGYDNEEEALKSFLLSIGINIDEKQYRIKKFHTTGIVFYYLEKKSELYGDWNILSPNYKYLRDITVPVGLCVEGIKISDNTPGFHGKSFVALANCTGKTSPTTNVARDNFEQSKEYDEMMRFIYHSYLKSISEKIDLFEKNHSLSWAVNEACYSIDRFVDKNNRGLEAFSDYALFNECLADESLFLLDAENQYRRVSLNGFGDNVWTIESFAFNSAMRLSQEISNCKSTAFGILGQLGAEFSDDVKNIYSDTLNRHYTSELFLDKYEISKILVDDSNRKIEFKWEQKQNRWRTLNLNRIARHYGGMSSVYIMRKGASVESNISNDVHFIKSKIGLLVIAGNPVTDFMESILENTEDERYMIAVEIICSLILRKLSNKNLNIDDVLNSFHEQDINSLGKEFEDYVDVDKLKNVLKQEVFHVVDFGKYYTRDKDY